MNRSVGLLACASVYLIFSASDFDDLIGALH